MAQLRSLAIVDHMHDIVATVVAPHWRELSIRQAAVNNPMVPASMHAVVKILTDFATHSRTVSQCIILRSPSCLSSTPRGEPLAPVCVPFFVLSSLFPLPLCSLSSAVPGVPLAPVCVPTPLSLPIASPLPLLSSPPRSLHFLNILPSTDHGSRFCRCRLPISRIVA